MPQTIPVHVINLDRRADRLAYMAGQLDAMGVAWERVPAIDGTQADDKRLARDVALDDPLIRMGRGSQACAATTMELLRRIAEAPAPAAVVVQDDTELSPDLAGFVADADWVPPGIGLVQFEKWTRRETSKLLGPPAGPSPVPGRSVRRLYSRTGGAGCFLVTRAAAGVLARRAGRLRFPIDHLLFNLNLSPLAREVGVAMIVPALARQSWGAFSSDIAPGTRAQAKTLASRLRRGLSEVRLLPAQLCAVALSGARPLPVTFAERTS